MDCAFGAGESDFRYTVSYGAVHVVTGPDPLVPRLFRAVSQS